MQSASKRCKIWPSRGKRSKNRQKNKAAPSFASLPSFEVLNVFRPFPYNPFLSFPPIHPLLFPSSLPFSCFSLFHPVSSSLAFLTNLLISFQIHGLFVIILARVILHLAAHGLPTVMGCFSRKMPAHLTRPDLFLAPGLAVLICLLQRSVVLDALRP